MSTAQIFGILRTALAAAGGTLAFSESQVQTLLGAASILASAFMSWYSKRQGAK